MVARIGTPNKQLRHSNLKRHIEIYLHRINNQEVASLLRWPDYSWIFQDRPDQHKVKYLKWSIGKLWLQKKRTISPSVLVALAQASIYVLRLMKVSRKLNTVLNQIRCTRFRARNRVEELAWILKKVMAFLLLAFRSIICYSYSYTNLQHYLLDHSADRADPGQKTTL